MPTSIAVNTTPTAAVERPLAASDEPIRMLPKPYRKARIPWIEKISRTSDTPALFDRFEDGRDPLSDADAHRRESVARATPPHLVEQRRRQSRSRRA
jgi:hypothetical protein